MNTKANRPSTLPVPTILSILAILATGILVSSAPLAFADANSPPNIVSDPGPGHAPAAPANRDNMILNGDFEVSSYEPGCHFNQSNGDITTSVAGITAWGEANEIDYMNDGSDCGYAGPPQSGEAKLAIHRQSILDAADSFCFELDSPVVAGVTYTASFYVQANTDFEPDVGAVEIGLAEDATSFGTFIFSGAGTTEGWTQVEYTFVAPVTASYLCVQPELNTAAWNHLDNFSLEQTSVATDQVSWGTLKSVYR